MVTASMKTDKSRRMVCTGKALVWGCQRIGDVVMSIPAMKILRLHAPHLHVRYVTTFYARDLLSLTGLIDEVRPVRLKGGIRNYLRWHKLRREVGREDYDRVFLLGKLSRFRHRIAEVKGFASIADQPKGHKAERAARTIMAGLGQGDAEIPSPRIAIPQDNRVVQKFRGIGLDLRAAPYLVVHPGCNRLLRRGTPSEKLWPPEKYGPLFERLAGRHPELRIVVVGAKKEKRWVQQQLLRELPAGLRTIDAVGKTAVGELLHLLKRASVLLAADSGVMHLATMTATPLVALFGPTNEEETGPYGVGDRAIKIRAVDPKAAKQDPRCMEKISVEKVLEAIEIQLKLM
jgi:ADP-heptose:LPS heptosyltransferase